MKAGVDIRTLMDAKYSGVSQYTFNLTRELLELNQSSRDPIDFKFFYNSGRSISHRLPDFLFDQGEVIGTRYPNKLFNYGLQKALRTPKLDTMLGVDTFWMPHFNFTCLSSKCRRILTVHDLSFLKNAGFFNWRKNIWHQLLNVKKMIREADHIVAISQNTKKDIIDLCRKDEDRISVVYSGVDPEFRPLEQDEEMGRIKEKYDLPEKFILSLGTLEPRKNIEGVIKAFNIFAQKYKTSPYNLVIVGMDGWKNESIIQAWKDSPCRHRIKFLGYVPNKDKVYLYNLASVFIFPSFYEGFGLPPLEAMACGTPVITSFTSSLPEVVGNAGLIVDPKNIRDIFEAIKQISEDERLRLELGQKSLERARNFSWKETADRYLQIIKGNYG